MDKLKGVCKIGVRGHDGFAVFYKVNKKECWNHIRNLNRLARFIKNLKKKNLKYEIYSCNVEKKINEKTEKALEEMIKKQKEKRLMLDD